MKYFLVVFLLVSSISANAMATRQWLSGTVNQDDELCIGVFEGLAKKALENKGYKNIQNIYFEHYIDQELGSYSLPRIATFQVAMDNKEYVLEIKTEGDYFCHYEKLKGIHKLYREKH